MDKQMDKQMDKREENLKKINADENEMLSDEELDNVAGGVHSSRGVLSDALEDFGEEIVRLFS